MLGRPAYSYSHYKKTAAQVNKHYTDNYRIPPIHVSYSSLRYIISRNIDFGFSCLYMNYVTDESWISYALLQEKSKPEYVHENGTSNGHTKAPNGMINGLSSNGVNGIRSNGHNGSLHSSSRMPFDVDIPIKVITYVIMGWLAMEWLHHLFHVLGLTAHS